MKTWILFSNLLGKRYTLFVAIVGNMLCFFSGMSLAWSSPVIAKLLNGTDDNPLGYPISKEEEALLGGVFSIGGAAGPIILIFALEQLGRKYTMLIMAVIFPIFHTVLAFVANIYVYYVCRVALGVAVGGSFSVAAIYIGEIVSAKMRGTYISLGTAFILTGCFFSYCIGPYVSIQWFNLIIAIASFIYVPLFALTCPETLYFTMQKEGSEKTLEILRKMRNNNEAVEQELEEIESSVNNEERGSFLDIFSTKAGIKAFFICTILLIFQQFSGITVLITYSQTIFENANVPLASEVCTIIVSAFQTATCLITPIAAKKFNRKLLMTLSFVGVSISIGLLGGYFNVEFIHEIQWIALFSLIIFVISYNCGVGPLPWVVLGEMYPLKVKSTGTALSNCIYWIVQFVLTYYFNKIDTGTSFFIFSGSCLVAIVFIQIFVIETKGMSLQEIQKRLGGVENVN